MYRKRRLEPWIPVDCLLHREIIQFVCEHDAPGRVERARAQIANEQAVVGINISLRDGDVPNHGPNAPVERVIPPDDCLEAQLIGNIANAVLDQQKMYVNIAIFKKPGKCGAHINIAKRRTPTSRCDAGDEFDGLYLSENIV